MMRRILVPLLAAGLGLAGLAHADDTLAPVKFQSDGALGSYDKAAAQRGFLVYQTVCASCHAASNLHYRDLEALGLSPDQVAGLAASIKLAGGQPATLDDVFKNPGLPASAFAGALPPDLSDIVNQRPGGTHYIYDYLTGFAAAPADLPMLPGHYYNTAYPGNETAMPNPLKGNDVAYADGTQATAPQEAADVAEFLTWASDPNLDARHEIGVRAIMFLVFLTVLAIATKRRIWRESV
jgi:ubiquinol-cytochrome c reductase cytochrome c1 subunit